MCVCMCVCVCVCVVLNQYLVSDGLVLAIKAPTDFPLVTES